MNELINYTRAMMRLKFSSDENFRQFLLLQSDCDSIENRVLVQKYLIDALKNDTMTVEESNIFTDHIDLVDKMNSLEAEKFVQYQELMLQEDRLKYVKMREDDDIFLKELDEYKKKWELEGLELEEKKNDKSFFWNWFGCRSINN